MAPFPAMPPKKSAWSLAAGYAQKLRIFAAQDERCASCGLHIHIAIATRHHIIPRAGGGPHDDANIAVVCPDCHEACHSNDRSRRHDALRPILIARGCTPEQRDRIYKLDGRYGVRSDNLRHIRNQRMPVSRAEYARWEDDGGSMHKGSVAYSG